MPRASKKPLSRDIVEEITKHFSYLLSYLQQEREINVFLDEFLTKEETLMLVKRLVLLMMIKRGYAPSNIKSSLKVSYETIRSHTNLLIGKSTTFHSLLEKLITKDQSQEFWKKLDRLFKPLDLFLQSKSNMKARTKLLSGDFD